MSVICMIHCLAIPLFLIFGFDVLLHTIDQEYIEVVIIFSALLIGCVAFFSGFKTHKQHFIPVLFIAGFLLIVNGESVSNDWLSLGLSLAGALIIIYAHIQNLKWKKHASVN